MTVEAHPSRLLGSVLEPVIGQSIFSPECNAAYSALGFGASAGTMGGAARPNGPAYFCSRGSILGQVPGEVIAAAFGVFNPEAVIPAVTYGWSLTDANTMAAARTAGAIAQLERILGPNPEGLDQAREMLEKASDRLRPEGKPLYAGLRALPLPVGVMGEMWRFGDLLREFRGDAHIAAWTTAGFDGIEIGVASELYRGIEPRTYLRTRAWTDEQLDAAEDRLAARGHLADGKLTEKGHAAREAVEVATDSQCEVIVKSLGDDFETFLEILRPWGQAIRNAEGYPSAALS